MTVKRYLALMVMMVALGINVSCKKERQSSHEVESSSETSSNRLKFKSIVEFKSMMDGLQQVDLENLEKSVRQFKGNSTFVSSTQARKLLASKASTYASNSSDEGEVEIEEPFEDLVPDPYFASVLNDKFEIQVEDAIYKVTRFGTFIFPVDKYDRVLQILSVNLYVKGQDLSKHAFYTNRMHDDFYKIEDKIVLFDTYKRAEKAESSVSRTVIYNTPPVSTVRKPSAIANTSSSSLPDYLYDNLPIVTFGAKTVVGKLFENLRGREEIYTEKYPTNDKRRVRVNFYNASWAVYSAIGVSVKFQKKNWVGWSETNCDELRLGWDALEYYAGSLPGAPLIPPMNAPQHFTPVDLPYVSKQYVEVNLLGHPVTFDKNVMIQKGAKQLFDYVKSIPSLNPKPVDYNYAVKVWSDFTKKSISLVQERDEVIGYNKEVLSKRFDWAVGLSIKYDFEDVSVGYAPLSFNLDRASVYGMAFYEGNWRGAHIVNN